MARRDRAPTQLKRLSQGAQNALEMMRLGRLTEPYHSPFRVMHRSRVYALRRYGEDGRIPDLRAPILFVPPLMVAAEIYDMAADVSAVAALLRAGMDVWLVDFGAPERVEGGMDRTLDDHVRAVDDAVDRVRAATGMDVHLAGYSQGGMFAYQVAAYRKSAGIASIVTFGSPVDIYRNLPLIGPDVAAPMYAAARAVLDFPIRKTKGLPGFLTSAAFKVLSVRKEVGQMADFVRKLHDRKALERQESRRRFLGGEGFVAWPGPALRTFIDEFIVHNRMTRGGFVIDGRTASLADIEAPVLYFVGLRDAIAHPLAVRAVRQAIPNAETFEVGIKAGHFGLVVGTRALAETWPTVVAWVKWREGFGPKPLLLDAPGEAPLEEADEAAWDEVDLDLDLLFDAVVQAADNAWTRLGDASADLAQTVSSFRYQLPRLAALNAITPETRIGFGKALAEKAAAMPDATFFLWEGRAFSYADAERRVDAVVRGLHDRGIRPGDRVGVLMGPRPSLLTLVTALNRLGAISVLLDPTENRVSLETGVEAGGVKHLVTDPEHAARARKAFEGPVLSLGGGGPAASLPTGVFDMESIDPEAVALPPGFEPNAGRASDLAMVLFTASRGNAPRAARITNRRWAVSALGAAATCTLTPKDTVFCCLPLHHPAGLLVAVGGALVGGSRLSLTGGFDPARFWSEVRRYGASVVFYAGDMLRPLVEAPASSADNDTPIRLFAGSGMPPSLWAELVSRFRPAGVLEFYASTEGNAVLANASGEKVGSVGRPLPGSAELAIVAYDFERGEPILDGGGMHRKVAPGEAGLLLACIDERHPMASYDGTLDGRDARVRRGVFGPDDSWYATGDVMRRDEEGDYFLLGAARDVVLGEDGPRFAHEVESSFETLDSVRAAAAFGLPGDDGRPRRLGVAVELQRGVSPEQLLRDIEDLPRRLRPDVLRIVEAIPRTVGYGVDRERAATTAEPVRAVRDRAARAR
jgi:putative long chain acyl-CoA synthase